MRTPTTIGAIEVGPPHSLKLGGPCQPLPIALPTKTEAAADAVLSNSDRVMVQRRKGSRLRIVSLCVAETTAVCRGAVIIAGLPPHSLWRMQSER